MPAADWSRRGLDLAAKGHAVIVIAEAWPQVRATRSDTNEAEAKLTVIKPELLDSIDLAHGADREVDILGLNSGIQENGVLVTPPIERLRYPFEINAPGTLALLQAIAP